MKRDFATTFAAEALVVACYLLSFRLVAVSLGTVGFGEYALGRRTLAVLMPLGALSLDVAVARYVAYAMSERSERARRYAPAAVVLVLAAAITVGAVLLVFQAPLADLFYGSSRYTDLVTPMPLLVLGGALHGIAYGQLRGRSRIQAANVLISINQGLVPLAAILLSGGSVSRILLLIGAGWTAFSVAFLAATPTSFGEISPRIRELARFGVPRIPGDLMRLALFSLPSLAVAHVADIATAGSVAFGVAAVGMLGTALSPIGFVMLPAAARMMSAGDITRLRRQVVNIALLTTACLGAGIAVLEVFAPQIVSVYLGRHFGGTVDSLRVIAPAALPWGIYTSLASVIDAHHVRPVNARNVGIGFAVFAAGTAVLTLLHAPALAIAGAFVAGLYVLGALTLFEVHTITNRTGAAVALTPDSQPLL